METRSASNIKKNTVKAVILTIRVKSICGAKPPWKINGGGCIPRHRVVAKATIGISTKPAIPTTAANLAPRDSSVAKERTMK